MNQVPRSLSSTIGKSALTLFCAAAATAVLLGSTCNLTNKAPSVPVISGPSAGVVGVPVTFKATATDAEGDSIAFQFDWGDTTTPTWSTFIASGETLSLAHTYADSGSYLVKATAKDTKGKESGWSDSLALGLISSTPPYPDSIYGGIVTKPYSKWCAMSPDGTLLCIANYERDSVTLVRLWDRTVLPSLYVGGATWDIAASPDGSHFYVTREDGNVVSIELPGVTVDTTVQLGTQSYGVTVTPDSRRVLVVSPQEGLLYALDADDLSRELAIDLGGVGFNVAVNPDGHTAYVSVVNKGLAVVDLDSGRYVNYLTGPVHPGRLAMSPDGLRLYVMDGTVMGIRAVSLPDGAEIAHLDLQVAGTGDLLLSPDGSLLVASSDYGLKYVDTRTWAVVCSLPCGGYAGLAARAQFDSLYAAENARMFVIGRK